MISSLSAPLTVPASARMAPLPINNCPAFKPGAQQGHMSSFLHPGNSLSFLPRLRSAALPFLQLQQGRAASLLTQDHPFLCLFGLLQVLVHSLSSNKSRLSTCSRLDTGPDTGHKETHTHTPLLLEPTAQSSQSPTPPPYAPTPLPVA